MPISVIKNIVSRRYTDFRGIDLLNQSTEIDIRRSPDLLNVWKSYGESQSNSISSRPGIKKCVKLGTKTIHSMYVWSSSIALVHIGNNLIKWVGFPDEMISMIQLKNDMEDTDSNMFFYDGYVYVLDGTNYLRWDGTNLINVESVAYIPTTTVLRSPSGRRRNLSRC